MSRGVLANRYAQAFFDFTSRDRLIHVNSEMKLIPDVLTQESSLWDFLMSPRISPENKHRVLEKVLWTIYPANEIKFFILFLLKKGRLAILRDICREFHELVQEYTNSSICFIQTAYEIDREQKNQIRDTLEKVTNKKLELRVERKPSLLAGIVARVQEKVYDFSIRSRLRALEKNLLSV